MSALTRLFYAVKPAIPRALQLYLRRRRIRHLLPKYRHVWPIDESAGYPPQDWSGWPDNKRFALVLMHDVDTQSGHDKCRQLMSLEERLGVRSAYYFVAEWYRISSRLMQEMRDRGFEYGIHGLKHDGKLFSSRKTFLRRAKRINTYLEEWDTRGFSSPSMHRNLAWMHELKIDYGTTTFDTDPFEPQPDGVGTIFPFWVNGTKDGSGYLELPYTLPQDFTLFVLMNQKNVDLWLRKIEWIAEKGGMALLNTHPDYMHFGSGEQRTETYPASVYADFIRTVQNRFKDQYWSARPSQLADFWSTRNHKKTQYTPPTFSP